jgi:hypothetical protein
MFPSFKKYLLIKLCSFQDKIRAKIDQSAETPGSKRRSRWDLTPSQTPSNGSF